jgi:hypothetical protein
MFEPCGQPISLSAEALLGIRFSLNTPVVESGAVPDGPARAAIVVHRLGSNRQQLSLGIRSLRTQHVTLFRFSDRLSSPADLIHAIEAALTFCESLGFLFDEDEVEMAGPAARAEAVTRWQALTEGGPSEIDRADAGGAAEPDLEAELEIDPESDSLEVDLAADDEPLEIDDPDESIEFEANTPDRGAAPVGASLPLSKFRGRPAQGAAEPQASAVPAGAELARIPLRKRRNPAARGERPSFLLRILAGF